MSKIDRLFILKIFKQAFCLIMCLVLSQIRPINLSAETFNSKYIYLDTSGMKENPSYDWSVSPQEKLKMFVDTWGQLQDSTGTKTIDGVTYVYWDTSMWNNTDHKFAIVYKDWGTADNNDYARTSLSSINVTDAKGQSFHWDQDSKTTINGKACYVLSQGIKDTTIANIDSLDLNCVYLDTKLMKENPQADWSSKKSDLYMYISSLDVSENNKLLKAKELVRYKGKVYVSWDVSEVKDKTGNFAFLYNQNWDDANTKDYYRTNNVSETTLEQAMGKVFFWREGNILEINGVKVYEMYEIDFTATDLEYSRGDESIDIPIVEGNKTKIENAYSATATFYDYYSDYELRGKNRKEFNNLNVNTSDYKRQGEYFNKQISEYFKIENKNLKPLYFGDFFDASNTNHLLNFDRYRNNSANNFNNHFAVYQGLVDRELKDGCPTMDGVLLPYFNIGFLRNSGVNLAKVYRNVDFPFTLENGYWTFDSGKPEYAVRLKYSTLDGYFLDRTGEAVNGTTSEGYVSPAFFPFNDSSESATNKDKAVKLDYMFGVNMEIPFSLTENGKVEINGEEKNITFNFSGDDDIWIFIDGKLVLDMGGDHKAAEGSIDFCNKVATVSSGIKDGKGNEVKNNQYDFIEILPDEKNTEEHVMKIFYMERGLWESNMKITFNFPKRNNIQIKKKLIIPEVDPIFNEAIENLKKTKFNFAIKNLVTDTIKYEGTSNEEKRKIFNSYTSSDKYNTIHKTGDVEALITTKDSKNVLSWYCPNEKKATDGQEVTDNRLIKIYPCDSSGKKDFLDLEDKKDYLTFDIYNESSDDDKGSTPFIALVDLNGTRIGAWLGDGDYSYQNNSVTIGKNIWKTIKVDLSKLKGSVLNGKDPSNFNFAKITEIQFSYWNDVKIYLGEFAFYKTYAFIPENGFSTDLSKINDYGSIDTKVLSPANGAIYSLNSEGAGGKISGGTFELMDEQTATFRDQFRKGSYISIQEVGIDPNIFSTKWTLYEDEKNISSENLSQKTAKVEQVKGIASVKNIEGTEVNDGRKILKASTGNDVPEGVEYPEHALAFYKYNDPDGTASSVNLKAEYYNTLKTTSITIKKSIKEGEIVDENKEYKFKLSFDNVASLGLEGNTPIVKEIILNPGKSETISGIPIGTYCCIKEVKEGSDEFTLAEVNGTKEGEEIVDLANLSVDVTINQNKLYEFINSNYPSVNIKGRKNWDDDNNIDERPETIEIQLQRRIKDSNNEFEIAKDKNGNKIENKVVSKQDSWEYSYVELPKYVDYTVNPKVEYEYKIIEVKVGTNEINNSGYNPEYTTDSDGNLNITNKRVNSITIIKAVSENESTITTDSAKFKIQKLKYESKDKNVDEIKNTDFDTSFTEVENETIDATTKFDNLPNGTYIITEVEAPAGYIKLSRPFKITLPYEYKEGDVVDGNIAIESGEKLDITLKVLNPKGTDLPKTGFNGILFYLFIGTSIMTLTLGAYFFKFKNRST